MLYKERKTARTQRYVRFSVTRYSAKQTAQVGSLFFPDALYENAQKWELGAINAVASSDYQIAVFNSYLAVELYLKSQVMILDPNSDLYKSPYTVPKLEKEPPMTSWRPGMKPAIVGRADTLTVIWKASWAAQNRGNHAQF